LGLFTQNGLLRTTFFTNDGLLRLLYDPTLVVDLDLRTNTLPSGLTFSRASAATDVINGVLTNFASGAPRISVANGYFGENEQRTNTLRNSMAVGAYALSFGLVTFYDVHNDYDVIYDFEVGSDFEVIDISAITSSSSYELFVIYNCEADGQGVSVLTTKIDSDTINSKNMNTDKLIFTFLTFIMIFTFFGVIKILRK